MMLEYIDFVGALDHNVRVWRVGDDRIFEKREIPGFQNFNFLKKFCRFFLENF